NFVQQFAHMDLILLPVEIAVRIAQFTTRIELEPMGDYYECKNCEIEYKLYYIICKINLPKDAVSEPLDFGTDPLFRYDKCQHCLCSKCDAQSFLTCSVCCWGLCRKCLLRENLVGKNTQ